MEDINSDNLLKYSVAPITIETSKKIIKQMKHCICKIKNEEKNGTGFLCYIPLDKNDKCPALVTSYNMFNDEDIKNNKMLKLYLNDDKEYKLIQLDYNRKVYFNENFGIKILIIEYKDNINNEKNYLELDDNLFNQDFSYENKSIYILQYQNGNKASVSYGKLKEINESKILHLCSLGNNSDGSPILNLSNNKVIGIQNDKKNSGFNSGTFLKFPITEMIDMKEKLKINDNNKKQKTLVIDNSFHIFLNQQKKYNQMNNNILLDPNQMNNIIQPLNNQIMNQEAAFNNNMNININPNMNIGILNPNNHVFGFMNNNNNNMFNNCFNMNNSMNMGIQNHNNIYFNMMNNDMNNYNNNMMMFNNNINDNQINMANNNNNLNQQNNIKEEKININNKYFNKLCNSPKNKINVTFKGSGSKTFIVDYGTPLNLLLTHYLKYKGMFYISDYITFIYNACILKIDDHRPIENVVSNQNSASISVSLSEIGAFKEFFFETSHGITLNLTFDVYSTIEELLQSFFNEINKPELFGKDDQISFIYNGKQLEYKQKEIIEGNFKEYNPHVMVIDNFYLIKGD